jgi:hypothetical protein
MFSCDQNCRWDWRKLRHRWDRANVRIGGQKPKHTATELSPRDRITKGQENIRMNRIKNLAIMGVVLIGCVCAQTGPQTPKTSTPSGKEVSLPQADNTIPITGSGQRPLEQALAALRLKFGWTINYEDPQYRSVKDTMDDPRSKGTLILAGTQFSTEIPAPQPPAEAPPKEKSLQLVVDSYNRSANPGRFEVLKGETEVSIVGIAARDDKDDVSLQKPFLDSPVTLPIKERTIVDTVELVCKQLSDDTHTPVALGVTPRALVDHTNAKIGGDKVPARQILAQALAASGHPLYWQLLFDPNSKSYLLNIHSVHTPKPPAHETPGKPPATEAHPSVPKQ